MPHIHTEPGQHDVTASAYIARLDGLEPTLILHKHKLLHKYLQFGGHVELHENPWQAIIHEITEESGYHMQQLQILQPASRLRLTTLAPVTAHPCPVSLITHKFGNLDHYHIDIEYAFVTNEAPLGEIGDGESKDIRAFTAEELAAIPAEDIFQDVKETGLFILTECLKGWTAIGTTEFI